MLEHEQWMRVPVLLVDDSTSTTAAHNRSNSSNSTSGNGHKRSSSATSTSSTASASTAGSSANTPTAAATATATAAAHGGVGSLVAAAAQRFCSPGGANRCISPKYTPLLSDIAAAGEAGGGLAVKLLQEWGTRGNPFQFGSSTDEPITAASSTSGTSGASATSASGAASGTGSGATAAAGDSDDESDTAVAAVPETKECAAVVAAASATAEERDKFGSQWVVTQAALNGLTRYTGHYLQMMRLIRPIAGEAFAGLCGLADLYLYTVFTLFAPRSRVAGLYGVGEEKSMPLVSEQEEFAELKEFMQRVRANLAPQQSSSAATAGVTSPNSYRGGTVTPDSSYTPSGSALVTPLASPHRDGATTAHTPGTPSYSNSSTTAASGTATGGMSHSPSSGNVAGSGSPQRTGTTTSSHSPNRDGSSGMSTPSTNSLVEALLPHRPIPPSASSSSSTVNAMAGIVGMSTAPPAPPVPKAVLPTPECLKTGAVGRYDSCAIAERVVAAESCLFVVQVLAAAQCRAHARKLLPLKDRARLVTNRSFMILNIVYYLTSCVT
jgi:trimeric autotransporter adhesin